MAHIDGQVHETKSRMGSCKAAMNNTESRVSLLVIQAMSKIARKSHRFCVSGTVKLSVYGSALKD